MKRCKPKQSTLSGGCGLRAAGARGQSENELPLPVGLCCCPGGVAGWPAVPAAVAVAALPQGGPTLC